MNRSLRPVILVAAIALEAAACSAKPQETPPAVPPSTVAAPAPTPPALEGQDFAADARLLYRIAACAGRIRSPKGSMPPW
ncbi:MAG: hypothetical protein ACHQNV_09345 [Vicinamibacteria bacterium]